MSNNELTLFAVAMLQAPKFGNVSMLRMLNQLSINELYKSTDENIAKITNIAKSKMSLISQLLNKKEIKVVGLWDEEYPESLKNVADPPVVLYYIGDLNNINFNKCFSIVGTRRVNSEGLRVTREFTESLSSNFHIVSGLALGVDAQAHEISLAKGNKNVAVLASSADVISPSSNAHIYKKILDSGGVILSETFPGVVVRPGMFVSRNRIVAGISSGTLVTQAGLKSGALITAQLAFDYDKYVYTVPGGIYNKYYEGNNYLIKNNKAKLATSVDDIYEDYEMTHTPTLSSPGLTESEQVLYNLLLTNPLSLEDLCNLAKININQSIEIITNMELSGVVNKGLDGKYSIS